MTEPILGAGRGPLGVVGYKPAVVARLDPRTLRPLAGARIRLDYGVSSYAWSPDGSRLVLGDVDDDALHVIDPLRVRRLATIKFGIVAEAPQRLAWLSPRRVAVVAGNPYDGAILVMADPMAGRVVSRRQLDPAGIVTARAGDRLVLLHTPVDQIGPVRLSVVDARGRITTTDVTRVSGGFQDPPDWDRPGAYGTSSDPGLAVDREGGRAFLVAAGPTVAEVDLHSLQVTYHQLRQPLPLLRRLAYGGTWDDEAQQQRGVGLTMYGPGNAPPRRLLGGQAVDDARLYGDLVYASVNNGGELFPRVVVSLRSGRVVASSEQPLPYLLLDDRGQAC